MARGAIYTADPNRQAVFSEMTAIEVPFIVSWVNQTAGPLVGGVQQQARDMLAVADVPIGSLPAQASAFVLVASIEATITDPVPFNAGLGLASYYVDGDWTPEGRPERMLQTYTDEGAVVGTDPVTRTWHHPIPPPDLKSPDPAGSWRYQHPGWAAEYVAEFSRGLGYWLFHEGIHNDHTVGNSDPVINPSLGRVWPTQVAVRATYTYRDLGSTTITFGDLRLIVIPYRCVPGVLTLT